MIGLDVSVPLAAKYLKRRWHTWLKINTALCLERCVWPFFESFHFWAEWSPWHSKQTWLFPHPAFTQPLKELKFLQIFLSWYATRGRPWLSDSQPFFWLSIVELFLDVVIGQNPAITYVACRRTQVCKYVAEKSVIPNRPIYRYGWVLQMCCCSCWTGLMVFVKALTAIAISHVYNVSLIQVQLLSSLRVGLAHDIFVNAKRIDAFWDWQASIKSWVFFRFLLVSGVVLGLRFVFKNGFTNRRGHSFYRGQWFYCISAWIL